MSSSSPHDEEATEKLRALLRRITIVAVNAASDKQIAKEQRRKNPSLKATSQRKSKTAPTASGSENPRPAKRAKTSDTASTPTAPDPPAPLEPLAEPRYGRPETKSIPPPMEALPIPIDTDTEPEPVSDLPPKKWYVPGEPVAYWNVMLLHPVSYARSPFVELIGLPLPVRLLPPESPSKQELQEASKMIEMWLQRVCLSLSVVTESEFSQAPFGGPTGNAHWDMLERDERVKAMLQKYLDTWEPEDDTIELEYDSNGVPLPPPLNPVVLKKVVAQLNSAARGYKLNSDTAHEHHLVGMALLTELVSRRAELLKRIHQRMMDQHRGLPPSEVTTRTALKANASVVLSLAVLDASLASTLSTSIVTEQTKSTRIRAVVDSIMERETQHERGQTVDALRHITERIAESTAELTVHQKTNSGNVWVDFCRPISITPSDRPQTIVDEDAIPHAAWTIFAPLKWRANEWAEYPSVTAMVAELNDVFKGTIFSGSIEPALKFMYRDPIQFLRSGTPSGVESKGGGVPDSSSVEFLTAALDREIANYDSRLAMKHAELVQKLYKKAYGGRAYNRAALQTHLRRYLRLQGQTTETANVLLFRCLGCGRPCWTIVFDNIPLNHAALCGYTVCQTLGPDALDLSQQLVKSVAVKHINVGPLAQYTNLAIRPDSRMVSPEADPLVSMMEAPIVISDTAMMHAIVSDLYTRDEVGSSVVPFGLYAEFSNLVTAQTMAKLEAEADELVEAISTDDIPYQLSIVLRHRHGKEVLVELIVNVIVAAISMAQSHVAIPSNVANLLVTEQKDAAETKTGSAQRATVRTLIPFLRSSDWGSFCSGVTKIISEFFKTEQHKTRDKLLNKLAKLCYDKPLEREAMRIYAHQVQRKYALKKVAEAKSSKDFSKFMAEGMKEASKQEYIAQSSKLIAKSKRVYADEKKRDELVSEMKQLVGEEFSHELVSKFGSDLVKRLSITLNDVMRLASRTIKADDMAGATDMFFGVMTAGSLLDKQATGSLMCHRMLSEDTNAMPRSVVKAVTCALGSNHLPMSQEEAAYMMGAGSVILNADEMCSVIRERQHFMQTELKASKTNALLILAGSSTLPGHCSIAKEFEKERIRRAAEKLSTVVMAREVLKAGGDEHRRKLLYTEADPLLYETAAELVSIVQPATAIRDDLAGDWRQFLLQDVEENKIESNLTEEQEAGLEREVTSHSRALEATFGRNVFPEDDVGRATDTESSSEIVNIRYPGGFPAPVIRPAKLRADEIVEGKGYAKIPSTAINNTRWVNAVYNNIYRLKAEDELAGRPRPGTEDKKSVRLDTVPALYYVRRSAFDRAVDLYLERNAKLEAGEKPPRLRMKFIREIPARLSAIIPSYDAYSRDFFTGEMKRAIVSEFLRDAKRVVPVDNTVWDQEYKTETFFQVPQAKDLYRPWRLRRDELARKLERDRQRQWVATHASPSKADDTKDEAEYALDAAKQSPAVDDSDAILGTVVKALGLTDTPVASAPPPPPGPRRDVSSSSSSSSSSCSSSSSSDENEDEGEDEEDDELESGGLRAEQEAKQIIEEEQDRSNAHAYTTGDASKLDESQTVGRVLPEVFTRYYSRAVARTFYREGVPEWVYFKVPGVTFVRRRQWARLTESHVTSINSQRERDFSHFRLLEGGMWLYPDVRGRVDALIYRQRAKPPPPARKTLEHGPIIVVKLEDRRAEFFAEDQKKARGKTKARAPATDYSDEEQEDPPVQPEEKKDDTPIATYSMAEPYLSTYKRWLVSASPEERADALSLLRRALDDERKDALRRQPDNHMVVLTIPITPDDIAPEDLNQDAVVDASVVFHVAQCAAIMDACTLSLLTRDQLEKQFPDRQPGEAVEKRLIDLCSKELTSLHKAVREYRSAKDAKQASRIKPLLETCRAKARSYFPKTLKARTYFAIAVTYAYDNLLSHGAADEVFMKPLLHRMSSWAQALFSQGDLLSMLPGAARDTRLILDVDNDDAQMYMNEVFLGAWRRSPHWLSLDEYLNPWTLFTTEIAAQNAVFSSEAYLARLFVNPSALGSDAELTRLRNSIEQPSAAESKLFVPAKVVERHKRVRRWVLLRTGEFEQKLLAYYHWNKTVRVALDEINSNEDYATALQSVARVNSDFSSSAYAIIAECEHQRSSLRQLRANDGELHVPDPDDAKWTEERWSIVCKEVETRTSAEVISSPQAAIERMRGLIDALRDVARMPIPSLDDAGKPQVETTNTMITEGADPVTLRTAAFIERQVVLCRDQMTLWNSYKPESGFAVMENLRVVSEKLSISIDEALGRSVTAKHVQRALSCSQAFKEALKEVRKQLIGGDRHSFKSSEETARLKRTFTFLERLNDVGATDESLHVMQSMWNACTLSDAKEVGKTRRLQHVKDVIQSQTGMDIAGFVTSCKDIVRRRETKVVPGEAGASLQTPSAQSQAEDVGKALVLDDEETGSIDPTLELVTESFSTAALHDIIRSGAVNSIKGFLAMRLDALLAYGDTVGLQIGSATQSSTDTEIHDTTAETVLDMLQDIVDAGTTESRHLNVAYLSQSMATRDGSGAGSQPYTSRYLKACMAPPMRIINAVSAAFRMRLSDVITRGGSGAAVGESKDPVADAVTRVRGLIYDILDIDENVTRFHPDESKRAAAETAAASVVQFRTSLMDYLRAKEKSIRDKDAVIESAISVWIKAVDDAVTQAIRTVSREYYMPILSSSSGTLNPSQQDIEKRLFEEITGEIRQTYTLQSKRRGATVLGELMQDKGTTSGRYGWAPCFVTYSMGQVNHDDTGTLSHLSGRFSSLLAS